VSGDWQLEDVLDLLSDEYARAILAATSVEPMSANELSDQCDASLPTIYRRIEWLQEYDLLETQTKVQLRGNNHEIYAARLEAFSLELDEGDYEGTIERTDVPDFHDEADTADRFTRMWEKL